MMKLKLSTLAVLAAFQTAYAQTGEAAADAPAAELDEIVVTATRTSTRLLDTPASVSVVNADKKKAQGGLGVNLTEVLKGILGLTIENRNNYAQDLQLSSRGSRAGVRGVRCMWTAFPPPCPTAKARRAISTSIPSAAWKC
ncbi:hypothetical protein [Neisseria perflava]|uniref:hypothetical protein n=1 Tax=Neisseria perflava TaxID=33053 RepID=UPI0020A176D7|nr:hypothetical protein [Neisseria perflava]MCP1661244.1 outer membrane receptor protein involved in Fe transport [Neisseria perflava]